MTTAKEEEIFKLRSALSLARLHFEQGLYDRAEPVYRRALLFFEQGEELRQCLQCLAVLYSVRNHYSDALEMYVRLLALNESEYGKTDRRTIAVMREMASIYVQMGQPQKADKIQVRATVREKERDRPYSEESEHEENGHDQQISGRQGQGQTTAHMPVHRHDNVELPDPNDGSKGLDRISKYIDDIRPLISGLIVDFDSSRNLMLAKFIIAVILLLMAGFVAMIQPRDPNPIDVYRTIPHGYKTADEKAQFSLLNDTQCSFSIAPAIAGAGAGAGAAAASSAAPAAGGTTDNNIMALPFNLYLSDWRDMFGIISGSIYEKQYWMSIKNDTVLDEEGRTFYGSSTAESKVIEQMYVVKKAVESFFIVKNRYPKRLTEKIVLPYTNPVTNLQELPNSQTLTIGEHSWTTAKSIRERARFYESLLNGDKWPEEPQLRPGSINTCSVTMVSQGGEFYDFILRGADRNGKPLLTSIPGKAFVVSLQGAKELETPVPPLPFAGQLLVRPRHVWLMRPDVSAGEKYVLHHFLTYWCALLAVLSLAFWVKKKFFADDRLGKSRKFFIYAIACLVLCAVYEISLLCP